MGLGHSCIWVQYIHLEGLCRDKLRTTTYMALGRASVQCVFMDLRVQGRPVYNVSLMNTRSVRSSHRTVPLRIARTVGCRLMHYYGVVH